MKRLSLVPGATAAIRDLPKPSALETARPGSTIQLALPSLRLYLDLGSERRGFSSIPVQVVRYLDPPGGWWLAALGAVSVDGMRSVELAQLELGRGVVTVDNLPPGTYAVVYGVDGEIPEGITCYYEQTQPRPFGTGGPRVVSGSMFETFGAAGQRNAAADPSSLVKGWTAGTVDYPGKIPTLPRPSNVWAKFDAGWKGGDVLVSGVRFGSEVQDVLKSSAGKLVAGTVVFDSLLGLRRLGMVDPADTLDVGLGDLLGLNVLPSQDGVLVWSDDVLLKAADAKLDTVQGAISLAGAATPDGKRIYRVVYGA